MINISQHSIIPLGYPVIYGYYNQNGAHVAGGAGSNYRSINKFYTFGCNKIYRTVPVEVYSIDYYSYVRGYDNSSVEPVESSTVSFKQSYPVYDYNGSYDICTYATTKTSVYASILNYPFLIFFRDNTPSVVSLSLGNSLSPDVVNDEEEMI